MTTNGNRFDPGTAVQDMATDEVDYEGLAGRVWTAMDAAIVARTRHGNLERDLEQILRSMRETHESMCSVYSMADRIEKKEKRKTGRWMDAVLLARPQYDAVFVGLLLAGDYQKWEPKFRKAGWAANAVRTFFALRRFAASPHWRDEKSRMIRHLKEHARGLGITRKEWRATTADVRGLALPRGTSSTDAIKPLPTPGQIIQQDVLQGGQYERLGKLLWQQWKFLCDPAHIGVGVLINKAALRGDPLEGTPDRTRGELIRQEVVDRSIMPSLVAIMSLVAVQAVRHRDNAELMAKVVKAWERLESGTIEGGVIWDGWARAALGVLPDPPLNRKSHGLRC